MAGNEKSDFEAAVTGDIDLPDSDSDRVRQTRSLREKLVRLIVVIVVVCAIIALLTVVVLAIRFTISNYLIERKSFDTSDGKYFLRFLLIGLRLFVKAVPWGLPLAAFLIVLITKSKSEKHTFESLARYLQLQLTVTIVFLIIAFFGNSVIQDNPITIIQVSLVDLIIAVLFGVAYANEPPAETVPAGAATYAFITRRTLKNIVFQALYQVSIILVLTFFGDKLLHIESGRHSPLYSPATQHFTLVYNVFVLMTLFNAINSMKLYGERNVFQGLNKNIQFIMVWISLFITQILVIQVGGEFFSTTPLSLLQWIVSIVLGASVLAVQQLIVAF